MGAKFAPNGTHASTNNQHYTRDSDPKRGQLVDVVLGQLIGGGLAEEVETEAVAPVAAAPHPPRSSSREEEEPAPRGPRRRARGRRQGQAREGRPTFEVE